MAVPARRGDSEVTARWEPFAELDRIQRQLASYLDSWRGLPSLLGDTFTPLADVEETDDEYVVEIDLAGVRREDVNVELSGRRLSVTGERKERERSGILRTKTRTVGRFQYEVTLPGDVDEDASVDATLHDGVLTLKVPKAAAARPRRIEVKAQ